MALQMTATTYDEKEEASSSTEDSKKKKPMKLLLVSPVSALQAQQQGTEGRGEQMLLVMVSQGQLQQRQ